MALNLVLLSASHTAPSTVSDLQLCSPGSTSCLEASWGAAAGERVVTNSSSTWSPRHWYIIPPCPPGTLSYNFSGLLPGSEYVLKVTTRTGNLHVEGRTHQWTGQVGTWVGCSHLGVMGQSRASQPTMSPRGQAWLCFLHLASSPCASRSAGAVCPGPHCLVSLLEWL